MKALAVHTYCFVLLLGLCSTAFAQNTDSVYVREQADLRSWAIGNGSVERVVRFLPSHGLMTQSWKHKSTGTDFIDQPFPTAERAHPDPGPEFSFQVGSRQFRGNVATGPVEFEFVSSQVESIPPGGKQLRIVLRAKALPIEVTANYAVYPRYPVIRKWLSIANSGTESIALSHMAVESLNVRAGPPIVQEVFSDYGVHPRETFFTGRVEDCLIIEKNAQTHEGLAILNEAPGWMKRTDLLGWGKGISVGYDTDIFPFERKLNPGETFTTAGSDVALFREDKGFEDPHWVIPGFVSDVMQKKGGEFRSPWFGNTWEPFFMNYDESAVKTIIPAASQMGLDVYTLDTGWSKDYADNVPDPKKFPNGLSGIRTELESKGMRMGMWVPLAVVSPESEVYKQHPEWAIRDYLGNEKTAEFPGPHDRVMCLASPYRRVAADRINDLIEKQHLKYVKIDLTTVFNAYGEAPGCHAKGHYHDNWAQSLEGTYEGIQFVTAEIYRKHPDVLLDLTFELWGQKHIIDYGLLAAGDLDWMSNVDDQSAEAAGPLQARMLLYQRGMAIPAETMLIGNLRATTPDIEDRFATAIGSAPVLLGDLRKLTPEQIRWYRKNIDWFKKLRLEVPMNQGFFPIGSWRQPNTASWDGYARLSRSGEGIIVLFKNQSSSGSAHFSIAAYPSGTFALRSVSSDRSIGEIQGSTIQHGMDIAFKNSHKIEIVEIRRMR